MVRSGHWREGGMGAPGPRPCHSLAKSVSLASWKNSQSISASTWLTMRPDVSRYVIATDDGGLAFNPSHCLIFSTHHSSITFTDSASIVLTYRERIMNITRWSHCTALCPKCPQAEHIPLNGARWSQWQANCSGLGAGRLWLGGRRGCPRIVARCQIAKYPCR